MTKSPYRRTMTRLPTTEALISLAEAVVATGFDANRPAVAEVVTVARRHGIRPVLAEIVADAAAPRAVRERALGRLIVALSAASSAALVPVTTGAASAA